MRIASLALASGIYLAACATIESASDEDRTMAFGCDDAVVVGRLSNQSADEFVPRSDDLIGHSWMEGILHVRRTVRGAKLSGDVKVRYSAHSFIREDQSFMFVLSRSNMGYMIETAQLMSLNPRVISACK